MLSPRTYDHSRFANATRDALYRALDVDLLLPAEAGEDALAAVDELHRLILATVRLNLTQHCDDPLWLHERTVEPLGAEDRYRLRLRFTQDGHVSLASAVLDHLAVDHCRALTHES